MTEERYTVDEDGTFDELFLRSASVHIERMDNGHIWMGFNAPNTDNVTLDFYSSRPIRVVPQNVDITGRLNILARLRHWNNKRHLRR